MKLLKIQLTLEIKGDVDDTDTLEADIREELQALAESDEGLDYTILNADDDDEEEQDED